jgi:hypothetical protein
MSNIETIGPLKSVKHEAYAQARASGKSLKQAGESAGFSSDGGNMYRLETNPFNNVKQRIDEIIEAGFKESDIDARFIIGGLAKLSVDETAPAAVQASCLKTLADIHGLRGQPIRDDFHCMGAREERDALLMKLLASQADSHRPIIDITND